MIVVDKLLVILALAFAFGFLFWRVMIEPRQRRSLPGPDEDRVHLGPGLARSLAKARAREALRRR